MRRIAWSGLAKRDLAAIDVYWWATNPARANEILDRIEAAGKFLGGVPAAGPIIENALARKWSVRGTHYVLLYRVRETVIEILRVHHQRENWRTPD